VRSQASTLAPSTIETTTTATRRTANT
jgi:hypothetical protein